LPEWVRKFHSLRADRSDGRRRCETVATTQEPAYATDRLVSDENRKSALKAEECTRASVDRVGAARDREPTERLVPAVDQRKQQESRTPRPAVKVPVEKMESMSWMKSASPLPRLDDKQAHHRSTNGKSWTQTRRTSDKSYASRLPDSQELTPLRATEPARYGVWTSVVPLAS
jgi:hypothetical protein